MEESPVQTPTPSTNIPPVNSTPQSVAPVKLSSAKLIAFMFTLIVLMLGTIAYLLYQNNQLKSQISSAQSTPTPTVIPDPTVNWKTYTNDKAGYEIRYPMNWFITDDSISNVKSPFPEKGTVVINFYSTNKSITNLDTLLNSVLSDFKSMEGDPAFTAYESKTNTTVADYPALKINGNGYGGKYLSYLIVAPSAKTNAHISIVYQEGDLENFQPIINQILSTFKFTEATGSANPTQRACTLEAKICPDGTSVGRTGPNCEFAACP